MGTSGLNYIIFEYKRQKSLKDDHQTEKALATRKMVASSKCLPII